MIGAVALPAAFALGHCRSAPPTRVQRRLIVWWLHGESEQGKWYLPVQILA